MTTAPHRKIVILTGAGISAESGLGTFRDEGGLWARHRIEDVATPEGFARNPALVHDFYNARREAAAKAAPNSAHHALAHLQQTLGPENVVIVTQNVDSLHEAAGARNVLHMHGTLAGALCAHCGHRWPAPSQMTPDTLCPACNGLSARPDVVWFGEIPYFMDAILDHLAGADLFISIGTSGQVYPAAGFVLAAQEAGAQTIEVNLDPSATSDQFDETILGSATQTVPALVEHLLAGHR
ncbi:NAD-dependent deacylase [Arenibacterium halophilum]|uniref:NAD-dependent protein deacylase n=1 Tax=Arenibacterium halophilum TaxID=2583821 RepID=A0ABY2X927_9RHOB|nr:NAD-dependent deacylase [Arenibacterium halophilum]TMV12868.1 NAD-dependent deacylase [Arenibacterium halophilum]